jgi:hypothetical protein
MSIARPLVGCLQGALGKNAGDMALIIRGGVNAATGIDQCLHGSGDVDDVSLSRRMPDKHTGGRTGINRGFADAAKRQPDCDAFTTFAKCHRGGRAGNGKIATAARNLHKAGAGPRSRCGQFDFNQHFIGLKIGGKCASKKVWRIDPSFLAG